jgi:hypothetical protein
MLLPGIVALLCTAAPTKAVSLEIVKGQSVVLIGPQDAEWGTGGSDAVTIERVSDKPGQVRITAVRDWFDETPNREPQATVTTCVGETCTAYLVTCLVDASGHWKLSLVGKWLGIIDHSEERAPLFVQNGRDVSFEDRPKDARPPYKVIRLRLNGASLYLKDGGGALKMFSGKLRDRGSGEGKFDSMPGFSGTWTAKRAP